MFSDDLLLSYSEQDLREVSWYVSFAFEKEYDPSITLFTLDTSVLDGGDILAGENNVLQEWDKYRYDDYSDRVIDIAWEREDQRPSSLSVAMADIRLNNYDGLFDPDGTSDLAPYMLPGRPVRIFAGFRGHVIQVFVGVTSGGPIIDERTKTVSFHCVDFFYTILKKFSDETILLLDARTDECLEAMFQMAGLTVGQYQLDVGTVTVPFFFLPKGNQVFDNARKLVEVEIGRLYQDEQGMIYFKNRANVDNTVVAQLESHESIVDATKRRENDMINNVIVRSDVRALQPNAQIWVSAESYLVPAASYLEVWADFFDPATTIVDPVYIDSAVTSSYTVNTAADGSGSPSSAVVLSSSDELATSYKMTFYNSSGTDLYITNISVYGTSVPVIKSLYVQEADEIVIEKYGEALLEVENDYFSSEADAQTFALNVLSEYGLYSAVSRMEVKGTPQYQLGDVIQADLFDRFNEGRIVRIACTIRDNQFKQVLHLKDITGRNFFILDDSVLDGEDVLSI